MPANPSPKLLNAIAQVLYDLAGDVEDLGTSLCASSKVALEHQAELQSFDLLCQSLCQLAEILASENVNEAVANIKLERLRQQFAMTCDDVAA